VLLFYGTGIGHVLDWSFCYMIILLANHVSLEVSRVEYWPKSIVMIIIWQKNQKALYMRKIGRMNDLIDGERVK
jgi:hypothetical protein